MNPHRAPDSDWLKTLPGLGESEVREGAMEQDSKIPNWRSLLLRNDKNKPSVCVQNALVAFRNAPQWQGVLQFDESALQVVAKSSPPWDSREAPFNWRDDDDVRAAAWLQQQGIFVSKDVAGQAIQAVARDFSYHPIRDYLNSLVWDGLPRINDWLTLYLSVESSDYARAVGSKWLIGGVARIMKPGCKNDTCLVLEGDQGTSKSTALSTLADPWFTDEISDLGTKDASMQVRGVWIIELAELDAMSRGETSRIKAFMSRSTDRYRPPYGRHPVTVRRESIFAGTVNHGTYLMDETGGRRFWPVTCGSVRLEELKRDRDQLWAEALVRFRADEPWWIDSVELGLAAADEQRQRYDEDPWQTVIDNYVSGRDHVTVGQILSNCLDKRTCDWTQADKNRIARSLRAIGWKRKRGPKEEDGHRDWRYQPCPSARRAVPLQ
jgi:predicted P-loop ATPase